MSTNTANRRRQPAGQPLGGAFAAESKPGAGVSLAEAPAGPVTPGGRVQEAAVNTALALHRGDYEVSIGDPDNDEYGRTWVRATGDYSSNPQASVSVAMDAGGMVSAVFATRHRRVGRNGESVSGRGARVLDPPVAPDDLEPVLEAVVADVETTQAQQQVIEREFNQGQDPTMPDEWYGQATAPDTVFFRREDGDERVRESLWVRTDSEGRLTEVTVNAGVFQNLTLTGEAAERAVGQVGHDPQATGRMLRDIARHQSGHEG